MTKEEAISVFETWIERDKKMEDADRLENIEIYNIAIQALEKDIAKEPVQTHKRYGHGYEYDDYYCPKCDKFLVYEPQGNRYKQEGGWSRCINCGQKITWESKNE